MSTTTSDSPSVAEPLVINTGPIVALCLAGATEPVGLLPFEFLAPAEVASEIAAGQERGYRVAMPGWVSIVPLSQPVGALGQSALDAGEAAVIELALQRRIQLVAIDEARGRRAAKAAGLTVTGSLGLLGLAKTRGLIPAVGPFVAAMQTGGVYLDDALVRRFLAAVGEPRS
jgi:predicted nucleic acid-binding protein